MHIEEIRGILENENKIDINAYKNMDWRLSLVSACRARQKVMVPKYTMRLELQKEDKKRGETSADNFIMDVDYTNLKRIQHEIEDALKSVDSVYSKKVYKFLK